jgi:type II secretory pathway pseudopilin PulG
MKLEGQPGQQGFAMAALLVSLAVMSVLMTAALPAWRHEAKREKEAELIFRGEQYARAIALFRSKNGNAFPPSVDVLVQGRYLRKQYLDPITKKDFDVIAAVGAQAGAPGIQGGGGPGRGGPSGRGRQGGPPVSATNPLGGISAVSSGIMGVHSKSQETSIRIYNGQTRYDQWIFAFTVANRPGGNVPGASNPGGPGAPAPGNPGSGAGGRGGRGGPGGVTPGQGGFQIPPFPGPRGGGGRGGGVRPPGA